MRPELAAVALLLLAAPAARAQPDAGEAVFRKWCAPCHAAGPGHPGTDALRAKHHGTKPAELEARRDLTAEQVRFYVRHGVSIMPFFRKTEISDAELDQLGAYLAKSRR